MPEDLLWSVLFSEDEIMRQALQEIWDMAQDREQDSIPAEERIEQVYQIVNGAVEMIDHMTKIWQEKMAAPCVRCGNDRHGYRHPEFICRYCAGENVA